MTRLNLPHLHIHHFHRHLAIVLLNLMQMLMAVWVEWGINQTLKSRDLI